jgi:hypothetical protein
MACTNRYDQLCACRTGNKIRRVDIPMGDVLMVPVGPTLGAASIA